ncbi:TIGR03915 family putative DNA repair protein [Pseudomonas sp. NPDC007930]|uniref:TIGR03915 family putative DNA repair protein n=1 Tax=Pseudomonas sp. NPDC007930 TaxID=3364417 RepID=UPI0036E73DC4
MISLECGDCFDTWRAQARQLLGHGIDPSTVSWNGAADLFGAGAELPVGPGPYRPKVPPELPELLRQAAGYRGPQRWSVLYEVLWRVAHGDRTAMLAGEALGSELQRRVKHVRRETHHLHAFLRFVPLPAARQGPEFVAWYEPAHDVLRAGCEHFIGRMGKASWLIATPSDGAWFDGATLNYQRPCPPAWQALARAGEDPGGELWLAYYRHLFNPARLNPKVMQGHMPGRFWKHLPEGPLIPALVSDAQLGKRRDGQARGVGLRKGKQVAMAVAKPPGPAASPGRAGD